MKCHHVLNMKDNFVRTKHLVCYDISGALAACNYIDDKEEREKIFKVLYKWLESSSNLDLQKTAYECLKKVSSLNVYYSCLLFVVVSKHNLK